MKDDNNLRHWLGVSDDYVSYCREERNFAAVLYHLLLDEGRLGLFLDLIGAPASDTKNIGIYFEYAHLRDLWAKIGKPGGDVTSRNVRYRQAIISMLNASDVELPENCKEFNEFFIGEGSKAASKDYIQMPSRWSGSQFRNWQTHGRDFARRACKLKWAFNAKPDLVLHLGGNKAICIEAKVESRAGSYQVKSDPYSKGCFTMGQLELQEFILKDLLGYETDFIVISKKSDWRKGDRKRNWRSYSWQETYAELLKNQPSAAGESRMVADFHTTIMQPA